jgi:tetratricopeptide (TPR) repeat protein
MCAGVGAFAQPSEAEQLIQAGHWRRARALVETRYAGDEALSSYLLSQIRYAFGDHAAPLALAEKAVALNGRVAKYHRQLAEVLGVQAIHANPFQQMLLARRFRREIDTALELDTQDVQAMRDLIEFYLAAPGIVGGDQRKAEVTAGKIGEIDAAEGFLAKARIAAFHKEAADTLAMLRKAAQSQPPNYRAWIELAQFHLAAEHFDDDAAEAAARGALNLDRNRVDAYIVLARIHARRSEWPALDGILTDASRQDPDDLAPYYYAGDELLRSGRDAARAERYFRTYLGQEPEGNQPPVPQAHWKLGLALEAEGRQMEAVAEWKEALRLDPESPAARDLKRLRTLRVGNQTTPARVQL